MDSDSEPEAWTHDKLEVADFFARKFSALEQRLRSTHKIREKIRVKKMKLVKLEKQLKEYELADTKWAMTLKRNVDEKLCLIPEMFMTPPERPLNPHSLIELNFSLDPDEEVDVIPETQEE